MTTSVVNGMTNSYEYNVPGYLSAVYAGANLVARYWYSPAGLRLKKQVGSNVVYFAYGDEGLIAEMDETGHPIRSYGYMPGSPWMSNPLYLCTQSNGATNYLYYLSDHLGAPQKVNDGEFKKDMLAIYDSCASTKADKKKCKKWASKYYNGVNFFGCDPAYLNN